MLIFTMGWTKSAAKNKGNAFRGSLILKNEMRCLLCQTLAMFIYKVRQEGGRKRGKERKRVRQSVTRSTATVCRQVKMVGPGMKKQVERPDSNMILTQGCQVWKYFKITHKKFWMEEIYWKNILFLI